MTRAINFFATQLAQLNRYIGSGNAQLLEDFLKAVEMEFGHDLLSPEQSIVYNDLSIRLCQNPSPYQGQQFTAQSELNVLVTDYLFAFGLLKPISNEFSWDIFEKVIRYVQINWEQQDKNPLNYLLFGRRWNDLRIDSLSQLDKRLDLLGEVYGYLNWDEVKLLKKSFDRKKVPKYFAIGSKCVEAYLEFQHCLERIDRQWPDLFWIISSNANKEGIGDH